MSPMLINQAMAQAEQFMCVIVKTLYQQLLQVYQLTQLPVVMS